MRRSWGTICAVAIAGAAIAGTASAGSAGSACGSYPAGVPTGYADCALRHLREKPLWRGVAEPHVVRHMRFAFTAGHGSPIRIVDIVERTDGTGTIRLTTAHKDRDGTLTVAARRSRRLARPAVAEIERLGSLSGTWDHPVGSWDGDDIFLHCETLDMERATSAGYDFSSASIGCNRPAKLMPLVNVVLRLIGLTRYGDTTVPSPPERPDRARPASRRRGDDRQCRGAGRPAPRNPGDTASDHWPGVPSCATAPRQGW